VDGDGVDGVKVNEDEGVRVSEDEGVRVSEDEGVDGVRAW